MSEMTPQEIADYKMQWLTSCVHNVIVNSDLDVHGKAWCRRNVERHKWSFSSFTSVYEHTFHFEDKETADEFEKIYKD